MHLFVNTSAMGYNIVMSEHVVDRDTLLEDWSKVRSPSRARRRRSRHRQNIRFYHPPSKQALFLGTNTIVVHPAMYAQLQQRLLEDRA